LPGDARPAPRQEVPRMRRMVSRWAGRADGRGRRADGHASACSNAPAGEITKEAESGIWQRTTGRGG